MKKITIVFLGSLALSLCGCGHWWGIPGNGHIVTENRPVTDFSEIEARGAFEIDWKSGPPSLSITADQNLLEYVDSTIVDHRLRLISHGNLRPTHIMKVLVSSPTRSAAEMTGATWLTVDQLTGEKFAVETTGAAQVTLEGNVNELLAEMTGASKLDGSRLQARIAQISTSGAGKADVAVSDTLKVAITGAGKVLYTGNPQTVEKHISGAGSIQRKE